MTASLRGIRKPPSRARRRAVYHPNRFVRETAHFTIRSLCEALDPLELAAAGGDLAPRIADGLSDNWSQVRRRGHGRGRGRERKRERGLRAGFSAGGCKACGGGGSCRASTPAAVGDEQPLGLRFALGTAVRWAVQLRSRLSAAPGQCRPAGRRV
jgi:hypothetical protein